MTIFLYLYFVGGLSGLFNMFGAYQRWCRTTSSRAQFFEKTSEMCDMLDDPESPKDGKHRELQAAQIRKSEEAVQRTITAIQNFTNPFTISDKDRLYSIASGAPISIEVELHVLQAEAVGNGLKTAFIKERFEHESDQTFFDPIRRQKLMTMEACNKTVLLTSTKGKVFIHKQVIHFPDENIKLLQTM